jgi:hypothetical protein
MVDVFNAPESRIIADLFLRGVDEKGWQEAPYDEHMLQGSA